MALREANKEGIYLRSMLLYFQELKIVQLSNNYSTILVDNLSARDLSKNAQFHERTKHIDIAYHFIRESISNNESKVLHISDKDNLSDILTKGVTRAKFEWFLKNSCLTSCE